MEAAAAAERHPASTSIERRTFARVFPDGKSVLRKLAKQVGLWMKAGGSRAATGGDAAPGAMLLLEICRSRCGPPCPPQKPQLFACRRCCRLLLQVKLQEACFRDVVILYRAAVPDKPVRRTPLLLLFQRANAWPCGELAGCLWAARRRSFWQAMR
jgi:hypothetical protein